MHSGTEEFLYLLLWCVDRSLRPTWRNLTDSYESWAYRVGMHRQLSRLEQRGLLDSGTDKFDRRVYRLTEEGRLRAMGGRDPQACRTRPWDHQWRLVLFDVPIEQKRARDRLRRYLRQRGFGCLQRSVWITPHPFLEERRMLEKQSSDVHTLLFMEARPAIGETDAEIVAAAWDMETINEKYTEYVRVLDEMPADNLRTESAAKKFSRWMNRERMTWLDAVRRDPLLPECLNPSGYLGGEAWEARNRVIRHARERLDSFSP